jgi:ketosteroid isomerase-like protein
MKNLLFLLLSFAAFGFVGCEAPDANEHAEEAIDLDAVRAELQGLEDTYAKHLMAKNADGVVAYYADNAQSLPPNEPVLVGKAAILAHTKSDMAKDTTAGGTIRFEVVDVFAEGNLAVEFGKSISTKADGTTTTGKYISVFEKQNGKWLCIRVMYSEDAPEKSGE